MGQINTVNKTQSSHKLNISVRMQQVIRELEAEVKGAQGKLVTLKQKRNIRETDVDTFKQTIMELEGRYDSRIKYLDQKNMMASLSPPDEPDAKTLQLQECIELLETECARWNPILKEFKRNGMYGEDNNQCLIIELTTTKYLLRKIYKADLGTNTIPATKQNGSKSKRQVHENEDITPGANISAKDDNSTSGVVAEREINNTINKKQTIACQSQEYDGTRSTNNDMGSRLMELKKQNSQLEMEKSRLIKERDQAKMAESKATFKLDQTNKRNVELEKEKNNQETNVKSLAGKLNTVSDNRDQLKEQVKHIQREWQGAKAKIEELRTENKQLSEHNTDLLAKISKFVGEKISNNNPNIVDLSDRNRPTKLGEIYSQLYDNEWTDAYDALTLAGHDAKDIILALKSTL